MNRRENINMDTLLRNALRSTETPDPQLVQRIKRIHKEELIMQKTTTKYSFTSIAAAALALLLLSTTAFAAWYYLKPSDVATRFGNDALSAAFESETAVNINQSITSGEYIFTLLATVSGSDLTDHPRYSDGQMLSGRTYAVLAIQNADGSPMPKTSDDAYSEMSFIASPLIKGLMPWQVNAWTMNGGYSEFVVDGILYRIVECDNVTMFADRGVYLGVATGSFINNSTFIYDQATGEITANPDYDGSSVVFRLPLDESLADPVEAQAYLDTMWDDLGGEPKTETDPTTDPTTDPPTDSATDEEADFSATILEGSSAAEWVVNE